MFANSRVILKDTAIKELVIMIYVLSVIKSNKIIEIFLLYIMDLVTTYLYFGKSLLIIYLNILLILKF
jgi:hypothetical protein